MNLGDNGWGSPGALDLRYGCTDDQIGRDRIVKM
jgi:hypothetical protein